MTIFINKGDKVQYLKGLDVPKVGGLFIDKLTMTMEIEPVLQKVVKKRFVELVNLGQAYNVATTIYDINIKPTGGDADTAGILIQCAPKSAGYKNSPKNFFRLECNPSHADLGYLKGLIDYLLEESGGYKKLMKTGSVTRLDISVDVDYLGPTDILASYGKIKTVLHFTKNGKIETKYLGATGSNKQIMLYDKTAEIVKSNKKKSAWGKDPVPDHKIMRIEIKLSKTKSTLSELGALPNAFSALSLTAYPEAKSLKKYDPLWSLFLSSCRFEGLENALLHLNDEDREKYMNLLQTEGKSEWWNPEKVWKGLPEAVQKIIKVKGGIKFLEPTSNLN